MYWEIADENSQENVENAGIKLLIKMYKGRKGDTLNGLRFTRYMITLASSQQSICSETLPPTESAAHFLCQQVYLQVQTWKLLSSNTTSEEEWGWKLENGHLEPVMIDEEIAPPDLLNITHCKCNLSRCSSSSCSFQKYGLHCVSWRKLWKR